MGTVRGARPPSQTAYFVALAGILALLLLLLFYFFYFCVRRVKELSHATFPEPVRSVRPPPATPAPPKPTSQAYPVQPGVRESATAMARLCQLPPTHTDTVTPVVRSPGRRSNVTLPPPRIIPQPQSPVGKQVAGVVEPPTASSVK